MRTIYKIDEFTDEDIVLIKKSGVSNICDAGLSVNLQLEEVPENVWEVIEARYEVITKEKE